MMFLGYFLGEKVNLKKFTGFIAYSLQFIDIVCKGIFTKDGEVVKLVNLGFLGSKDICFFWHFKLFSDRYLRWFDSEGYFFFAILWTFLRDSGFSTLLVGFCG